MSGFVPHSRKQELAVFSDRKITLCGTGIQWGKTRVGAVRMKMKMHQHTEPDDAFIICAPTYKIMAQSTLPAFLAMMKGLGVYRKVDQTFEMFGGGTCYFRTNTDPDSIVGMTKVKHIWGDEAGKFSLYFWENIQGRASFGNCQIDLTTSPYSLNWIYKEIIRRKMRDPSAVPDCLWIRARSDENPYFDKRAYARAKETMDPRRFNMMYGGQWDKMSGLVYDCFDEMENSCEPFQLPRGTRYVAGVDWGYTGPGVILVRAITPGGLHYNIFEEYKREKTITQWIETGKQIKATLGVEMFFCDPSQPGYIQQFNEAGLSACPAINDLRVGIDAHYDLIKRRRFKLFRGRCPFSEDEYLSYHYPEPKDIGADDDVKEDLPVKQNDHAMDADRYITVMTVKNEKIRSPFVPGEEPVIVDGHADFERLKQEDIAAGVICPGGEEW